MLTLVPEPGNEAEQLHCLFGFVFQDDYRRGVDEYDEKVFVSFKLILRELRNIYVSGICFMQSVTVGQIRNVTVGDG